MRQCYFTFKFLFNIEKLFNLVLQHDFVMFLLDYIAYKVQKIS